jgi:enoyl-CoA hydratase/carnithine racemase
MAVEFTSRGHVGTITIDNPPANSYDLGVMSEFGVAVDEATDSGARAVIVRSASPKFFSAGADVKKFLAGDTAANMEMISVSQAAFRRMAESSAVFIAHIAGHALGGGLEIALACDVRVATAGDYKLGTPEVNLGLLPGNGGTQRLTRLLGPSRALELLLTGRTFSAREAYEWGLVSALYDPEDADDLVRAYALRFATGAPLATAAIKRCVHVGGQLSLAEGLALEADEIQELFNSQDAREGMHAFVEKRDPEFVGA